MPSQVDIDAENLRIAQLWCKAKGPAWSVREQAGRGGTAPVFSIIGPDGDRALKIYDEEWSVGEKARIEERRIRHQVELGAHDCPHLIKVFDGGKFEERFFLLMELAEGSELEKCLNEVPRGKIRGIVDQIARAALFLDEKGLCHRDIKSANIFVSQNFDHVKLLDLSVTRDIHDPVGLGTDHDGQLPVVATARYSPPEYLFRLIEPGPELWHALNVYQLGGLLHDLIMKRPLFEHEYQHSKENRYRFAWAVATINPRVEATDVDHDLIFIARRALDKDWKRRSALQLQDFLANAETSRSRALELLGLSARAVEAVNRPGMAADLRRLEEIAARLDVAMTEYLRSLGAIAHHLNTRGEDGKSRVLRFTWAAETPVADPVSGDVQFQVRVKVVRSPTEARHFECSAELTATVNGEERTRSASLPHVSDGTETEGYLVELMQPLLASLAEALMRDPQAR